MNKAILLTGRPGCGKTTLIQRVVSEIAIPCGGFFTQEIREGGARSGFEIVTVAGGRGVLAHVEIRGSRRVGRHGVDTAALDSIGVSAIQRATAAGGLVVIDEIGPMELLSVQFRAAVLEALDSEAAVLGTIAKQSRPFTDRIRSRPDVTLIEVRPDNRDALVARVLDLLGEQ